MKKAEFLDLLRSKLSTLPASELEERLNFYGEMIDDRIEERISEEEAVSGIGSIDEVAAQIMADAAMQKEDVFSDEKEDVEMQAKKKTKQRRLKKLWIVLLAVGIPLWLPVAIALVAVLVSLAISFGVMLISLYVSAWSVIFGLWGVFVSLVVNALVGFVSGITIAIASNVSAGLIAVSVSLLCAGLSIFAFFGCFAATKGLWKLSLFALKRIGRKLIKRRKQNE